MITWAVVSIFVIALLLIVFEKFDKAVVGLSGAILMVVLRVLDFHEAVAAIKFETIVLLMSMMLLVEITREAGVFSWVTVRLAGSSKGNPLYLFVVFAALSAIGAGLLSAFTIMVLMIPITVALIRGMGRDPYPYIMGELFFANLGGSLTLIGDPSNTIIGGASHLSFNQFVTNLALPVAGSLILVGLGFVVLHWKSHLKPISTDLKKLFVSQLLLKKIEHRWLSGNIRTSFMIKAVIVLFLTLIGFISQGTLGLSVAVIGLTGALLLLLVAAEEADLRVSLKSVEWSMLLFFASLFVMVAAIEKVGVLEHLSEFITQSAGDNYLMLLLTIVWVTGIISMLVDNIPFVTLMVPVILKIQADLPPGVDPTLLWWALSMGATFGGNGTMIGASSNVVCSELSRKEGVPITFLGYLKYGLPVMLITLSVASVYLVLRLNYFV